MCVVLCGCGEKKVEPQVEEKPGRPDTKAVEAAGMVGYDGKQMRKAVDKALDKTEERNKDLQDALKQ
jgi:Holliday junction resolvasome RuvABC DNA-binding subunit